MVFLKLTKNTILCYKKENVKTTTMNKKRKVVLTETDKQKISVKFFELFVKQGKVFFPKSTYQLVRFYNKFGLEKIGIGREKFALFLIETETNKLKQTVDENQAKMDKFRQYFKLN